MWTVMRSPCVHVLRTLGPTFLSLSGQVARLILDGHVALREEEERDGHLLWVDIASLFHQPGKIAHAAVEGDEGIDAIIARGCEEIGDSAPTESGDSDLRRVGIGESLCEADEEGDIARLRVDAGEVPGHMTSGGAHVGAGEDEVSVTGEVFAEVGVLPGHSREAGRVDDNRKAAGFRGGVAHGPERHGECGRHAVNPVLVVVR